MAAGGSSHSLEARYAHVPGSVVDCPSTSKGRWCIEDDVPDDPDPTLPFGEARTVREGDDVTIVSWSDEVHVVMAAVRRFSIGLLAR